MAYSQDMLRRPLVPNRPARRILSSLWSLVGAALLLCACPEEQPPNLDAGTVENDDDGGLPPIDDDDAGTEPDGPVLLSLTLSPEDPVLPLGASVRLRALGHYEDGATAQLASSATWSSDAPAIADVGNEGSDLALVTAYAAGDAKIRATVGDVVGSVTVTVPDRVLLALEVSPTSSQLSAGQTVQLLATASYDDDTSGDVTAEVSWSSSAPAFASVDAAGLVTSLLEGSAEISASLGGLSAKSDVVIGPPVVVQLSSFNKHSAALLSNGRLLAFGQNRYGQTGVAPGQSPELCTITDGCTAAEVCDVNAGGGLGVCSSACLEAADCAIGDECDCVERDDQGACTKGWCIDVVTAPTLVPGITGAKRVATTGFATFALLSDGTVLGFGRNTGGLFLGDGDDIGRSIERTPQPLHKRTAAAGLERLTGVVDVVGGQDHVVALDEDGHVWAFGRGWVGQVGDGDTSDENAAVLVTLPPVAGSDARVPLVADAIAAGAFHTLAVERGSGRVLGWGWNGVGQLGDGTKVGPVSDNPDTPALDGQGWAEPVCALASGGLTCLTGASQVDAGWAHSVALTGTDVLAWGWNGSGQLGDGDTVDRYLSGAVVLSDVVTLESGFVHVAALSGSGQLYLWGGNPHGQLADGTADNRPSPAVLTLPSTPVQLSSGSDHTLALLPDGRVYVWGWNLFGELGLGDRALRNTPVLHPTLSP